MKRSPSERFQEPSQSRSKRANATNNQQIHDLLVCAKMMVPIPATHYEPSSTSTQSPKIQLSYSLLASSNETFPTMFLPTTVLLIVDTGASGSISHEISDFISTPRPVQPTTLQGIASGLKVDGIGTAAYTFLTATGEQTTVTLPKTLYVPKCTARLLCPRHLAAATGHPDDGFTSLQHTATLTCNGTMIPVAYDAQTKLPFLHATIADTSAPRNYTANNAVISNSPPVIRPNLTNAQRIKLLWHERLNHRNMDTVSRWIRAGLLPVDPSVASCPNPICASC